jgi:hypothetical protein
MRNHFFFVCILFLLPNALCAQQLYQTVRGTVNDKISNEPLIGALVVATDLDPAIGAATDENGNFKLMNIPIGRRIIVVNFLGYKTVTMSNVLINSGKELVLNITMEEELALVNEVTITAEREKNKPLNSMAGVSARTFSVEETQKFAAAVNDPSRMATSFAGVVSGDDGNNRISIRGNSPYGLLWRMEGADIPNPNHFANPSSSGGGISILSAQTLSNSDFFTGAFPAEYGNALSGVFDLRLRKGNNEKREYTLQAGFMGLDAAVEGPFKKGYAGSYLINYRYSTLSVLDKLGVPIGDGITNFQDVSYNFYFPTKRLGSFELYGFVGLSDQNNKAKRDTTAWEYNWQRYDSRYFSNTGAAGIKHVINLGENSYLQSSIVLSGNDIGYYQAKLNDDFTAQRDYEESDAKSRIMMSSMLNHKFNARHSLRTGFYLNKFEFSADKKLLNTENQLYETVLTAGGDAYTVQSFAQWKFRVSESLTLNSGVHVLSVPESNASSVEPRFSARYQTNPKQTWSVGYGLHSQMQPTAVYHAVVQNENGNWVKPNENLGLNKAHHFVTGYERMITDHIMFKTELYYQALFNIAVADDSSNTFSTLNGSEDDQIGILNNKGKGRNYGAEVTIEQFTYNNMYFLFSGSLYNSEYAGNDGVWRNTRFNANFAAAFTAGKEWAVGKKEDKQKTFGFNLRTIYTGGMRETPIDLQASIAKGETVFVEEKLFESRKPDYLRIDMKVSLRTNHKNATSTLALDLLNAINYKNVFSTYFDAESGTLKTAYQLPLLPVLSYKLEF